MLALVRGVSSIAASLALLAPAFAAPLVIHAGHVILEPGRPVLARQSILIENGKIVAIQDGFVPGEAIDLTDSWVMPGMIDMHAHVTGQLDLTQPIEGAFVHAYMARPAEVVLSMLPRMKTLLMNGFTTIRSVGDVSSTTYDLRDAITSSQAVARSAADLAVGPQVM